RVSVTTTPVAATGPAFRTVNVYGTCAPGLIWVAVEVFVIEICGCTGSGTWSVHSAAGGVASGGQLVPGAITSAALITVPSDWTSVGGNGLASRVTTLIATLSPALMSPRLQVTNCPFALHPGRGTGPSAPWSTTFEDTNVRPVGRVSVTTTL